jgi:hypothetical protein
MTSGEDEHAGPKTGARKPGKKARGERLEAALRANLKRRKEQARARAQAQAGQTAPAQDSEET